MASMKQSSILQGVAQKGRVLQVVSTTKTDTYSTTSTSYVDVTGLSASITPSATSSKILVTVSVPFGYTGNNISVFTIRDGSDNVLINPDSPGDRAQSFFASNPASTGSMHPVSFTFLHEPSTTSAFTYKVSAYTSGTAATLYVNRSATDTDALTRGRGIATITLMEVAG